MVRIYAYNDIRGFNRKIHNVKSNLCTFYYADKSKFCGNYCSRSGVHGYYLNRRCWRHKRPQHSALIPPVVLLMISASERMYNRDVWIKFITKCEERRVPLELVIYHEDMENCTVRESHNLLSRFRPFPDIFGKPLTLRNMHGGINFTQIYLRMLEYGCRIPHAARCIVLTERTIPIRSPKRIYRQALASKCHINISYNVGFGPLPAGLPRGHRNKPYEGVNNLCQGLFTTEFLRMALPTIPTHCHFFGITLQNGVYTITDYDQLNKWRSFTGSNPSEFWLLNSFLLDNIDSEKRPMRLLQRYMESTTDENDVYTVAEIPQWRDLVKRTYVFRDRTTRRLIPRFDVRVKRYYRGLNIDTPCSLDDIVYFLKKYKKRALFFRQVELP